MQIPTAKIRQRPEAVAIQKISFYNKFFYIARLSQVELQVAITEAIELQKHSNISFGTHVICISLAMASDVHIYAANPKW